MNFVPGWIRTPSPFKRMLSSAAGDFADSYYVNPAWWDVRSGLLQSSDQGQTSQCVAYSVAGLIEYYDWIERRRTVQIDPGPIYKRAKEIDGLPDAQGTTLEAGVEAARQLGLLKVENVRTVTGLLELKEAMHCRGVVLMGMVVDDGWMDAKPDGMIIPSGRIRGGHCVLGCAYDDEEDYIGFQNSWGWAQGWRGYNRMRQADADKSLDYGLIVDLK